MSHVLRNDPEPSEIERDRRAERLLIVKALIALVVVLTLVIVGRLVTA